MLYHFLYHLSKFINGFHVTRYITFRAMVGLLTALLLSLFLSPWFIEKLRLKQIGQQIRQLGPKSHLSKAGTPTMGGGLIIFTVLLTMLCWMDLTNSYLWYSFAIILGFAFVGFADDYLKVSKKNSKGLSGRRKLFFQTLITSVVCILHYIYTNNSGDVAIPFLKDRMIALGPAVILFHIFVIIATSNAVNITDGLDGLAIGPVMTTAGCFILLAYVTGHFEFADYLNYPYIRGSGELSILSASLVGAGIGFLWYNTYPAQVFMGDTGSLPLGGALGAVAVFTRHELLLAIIGGIFVIEAASVILQVASFKLTGKRMFKMAPIHHHFELKGWAEPKVIVRFWIISVVLGIIGLISLKLR